MDKTFEDSSITHRKKISDIDIQEGRGIQFSYRKDTYGSPCIITKVDILLTFDPNLTSDLDFSIPIIYGSIRCSAIREYLYTTHCNRRVEISVQTCF